MSALVVNKKHLRRLLLDIAARDRSHKFTSVANSVYHEAHSVLAVWCVRKIASLPSKGKTIK